MCGIAGLVHFDGAPVDPTVLKRMTDALRHRGPDDEGMVTWPLPGERPARHAAAGLGCRRLSIIDVQGGHQPIANETRDIWTTFNGEIYNFAALRAALEPRGHTFATHSDTEVLVHAYEEYGDAFVEHLDGMFALAIWDGRRERLLLARDRAGKKPLFYRAGEGAIVFASELHALWPGCRPAGAREIDQASLAEYLAYMAVAAPRTIYRDVCKLPPAHLLVVERDGARLRQYWSLPYEPKVTITEDAAVDRVTALLTAAVRKRLISDVPLGAFLSGGVDSAGVVALMASESNAPVKTFSIGFEDERYNELPRARATAEALGCDHHEFVVRPQAIEVLPRLARHFGEPYADSSAIPTSYLAELTRHHVTVALTGDGGDEVFGGYGRHRRNRMVERWIAAAPLVKQIGRAAGGRTALASPSSSVESRMRRVLASVALSRADRYRAWAGVFAPAEVSALTGRPEDGQSAVERAFTGAVHLDAVDAMLSVDTTFYLPTDLLPKMDITTMMHSLEARSPWLDRDLMEFVARLPSGLKVRRRTTKYLLKRALQGRVPAPVLSGPKRGFAVPIGAWLRGELRDFLGDHLSASRAASAGLVRQRAIDEVMGDHLSGAADRAHHVWTLLMLELWYRECAAA